MRAVLAIAFLLLALDWAQTLRIAREPEHFAEGWNLILPAHPSVTEVHVWFAAVALLAGIALWLLPWARLPLGIIGIAVEGMCVVHNYRNGLKP